jgi:xylulokinase
MSEPCQYVLAIDFGTSGPKVGLVDDAGRVLASAFEHIATLLLPGGGAEQDANEWWRSVLRTAKRVLAQARVPPKSVMAVACTAQYASTVAVDRAGEPLMNAITWLDTRGAPYNQRITRGFPTIEGYGLARLIRWLRLTGGIPTRSGVDSLGHILFIKNERPEVYRQTHKFLEPADYLTTRLTGIPSATQSSVWSMFLTDSRPPDCLHYDAGLVRISGIDPEKLPTLLPKQSIVGPLRPSVADELDLSPDTLVMTGSADMHTSVIGSGAVRDYEGVIVLGSSTFLTCHVPAKKTDITHFLTTMPSPLPGRYVLFADMDGTGPKVLDAFLANLVYPNDLLLNQEAPPDVYDRVGRAVEEIPPGSDGVLALPWFNGTLCPQEDPAMRGGFVNVSYRTTRTHLTRALLEGIAYNSRWLMGAAEKFTGRRFAHLRLAGGGAQSDTWAQIMADVLNVPIHQQADPRNGNVLGAAFLAFLRLGRVQLEDIPSRVHTAHVFEPHPENRTVYDRLFAQFMACRRSLKPVFHALNCAESHQPAGEALST